MAFGDYRDFLQQRGLMAAMPPAAAQAASDPARLAQAVQIARTIQGQQAQTQAQPSQNFALPPNPSDADHAAMLARVIGGLNEQASSQSAPYVPPVYGNQNFPIPFQGSPLPALNPQPQPPIPDVSKGQGQGAGPASLAATTPVIGPDPVSQAVARASSAVAGIGQDVGSYAADRYEKWLAALNAANTPTAGQNWQAATGQTPITPATTGDFLAPVAAGVGVIGPDVVDVGGKVIATAAKPVAKAIEAAKSATWDQLAPDVQLQLANSWGLSRPPTTADLKTGLIWAAKASQYPQQSLGAPAIGYLIYEMATTPDGGIPMSAADRKTIIDAYNADGGKGVWEKFVAKGADGLKDQGTIGLIGYILYHGGIDTASDPLAWTPLAGGWLKGMAEAAAAEDIATGGSGLTTKSILLNLAGHGVNAPNELADLAVENAKALGRGVGGFARRRVPGADVIAKAVIPTNEAEITAAQTMDALNAFEKGGQPGLPPAPGTTPPVPGQPVLPSPPGASPLLTTDKGVAIAIKDTNGSLREVLATSPDKQYVIVQMGISKEDGQPRYAALSTKNGSLRGGGYTSVQDAMDSVIARPGQPALPELNPQPVAEPAIPPLNPEAVTPTIDTTLPPNDNNFATLDEAVAARREWNAQHQPELPTLNPEPVVPPATEAVPPVEPPAAAVAEPGIPNLNPEPQAAAETGGASVKTGVRTNFADPASGQQFTMMPQNDGTYSVFTVQADGTLKPLDMSGVGVDMTDKNAVARAAVDRFANPVQTAPADIGAAVHGAADIGGTAVVPPEPVPVGTTAETILPPEAAAPAQDVIPTPGAPTEAIPLSAAAEAAAPVEAPIARTTVAGAPIAPITPAEVQTAAEKTTAFVDQHVAPVLAATDPVTATAIRDAAAPQLERIAKTTDAPGTWGIDKQIAHAQAAVVVRDAARANGIDLPAEVMRANPILAVPEKAATREARIARIISEPDWNAPASKIDRRFVYQTGDIRDELPTAAMTQKVTTAALPETVRDANGYIVKGGVHINDAIMAKLPQETRDAILAGGNRNAFFTARVNGQYLGRVLTNENLSNLSIAERDAIARVIADEQRVAYQRGIDLQAAHAQTHDLPVAIQETKAIAENKAAVASVSAPTAAETAPANVAQAAADQSIAQTGLSAEQINAARGRVTQLNETKTYQGPYRPLIRKLAKDANSAQDIADGIDSWATEKYGPREKNVHFSQKTNRAGKLSEPTKEVYDATTSGRGWKAADQYKEAVQFQWDDGLASYGKSRGGVGIVGSAKAQKGVDAIQAFLTQHVPRPLDELGPQRVFAPSLEARVNAAALTADEAAFLETPLLKVSGTDRVAPMAAAPIYQRYEAYLAAGLSQRDATLQTVADVVANLHPRAKSLPVQRIISKYDALNKFAKDNIQYNLGSSIKGPVNDWIGDGMTMIVTGHAGAFRKISPLELRALARAATEMDPTVINALRTMSFTEETGIDLPGHLVQGNWKSHLEKGVFNPRKDTSQLSLVRGTTENMGQGWGTFMKAPAFVLQNKWARLARNVFDLQRRASVYMDQFLKGVLGEGMRRFDVSLRQAAAKAGADPEVWLDAIKSEAKNRMIANGKGDLYRGSFSAADVLNATGDTTLSRKWQMFLKDAARAADKEQQRVLFNYHGGNLDSLLTRVMYFHYWASRALALHAESALRNPFLLATYVRAYDGLQNLAKSEGYPPTMMGMLEYFHSKQGWLGFINPIGMLTPFAMLDQMGNTNMPWYRRAGVFLTPMVEAAYAAIGGTDTTPDITGTTTLRGEISAVLNAMDAHGVDVPGARVNGKLSDDYVLNLQRYIYEKGNKALNGMGLTVGDYAPYDPKASEIAQIKAVITTNAIAKWGPQANWTPDQQDQYMKAQIAADSGNMTTNPDSLAAYKEVADAQLLNKGAGMIFPGGSILKYGPLEQAKVTAKTAPYGTPQSQLTPEQIAAQAYMSGVNASGKGGTAAGHETYSDARLTDLQSQYANIGTPRQQSLSQGWNAIAYGTGVDVYNTPNIAISIGGKDYLFADMRGLSDADRKLLADQWVAENLGTKDLADYEKTRKDFVTAHPEMGDFKTWQKGVFAAAKADPNGMTGWRESYARANPNFGRAMAAQEKFIRTDGSLKDWQVQAELDKWATSRGGYEATYGIPSNIYDQPATDLTSTAAVAAPISATAAAGAGGTAAAAAPKQTTTEKLTADLAQYQTDTAVLNDQLAQDGLVGGLQNYTANRYLMKAIQNKYGALIPTKTALQTSYENWAAAQPNGADTSPTAFGRFYDTINPPASAIPKVSGWSAKKTKMYLAWKQNQPLNTDTSTGAFDRYLTNLSVQSLPAYAPPP